LIRLKIEDWRLKIGDWQLAIGDWRLALMPPQPFAEKLRFRIRVSL
jgi:hypothetical protein